MKIEKKYTKLTPAEAAQLLAENNMRVENCIFSNYEYAVKTSTREYPGTLVGSHKKGFIKEENNLSWLHCWHVEEVQVLEVGDWVRCPDGVEGELVQTYLDRGVVRIRLSPLVERDMVLSTFTYVPDVKCDATAVTRGPDSTKAPADTDQKELDAIIEACNRVEKEAQVEAARVIFRAGREYESRQHDTPSSAEASAFSKDMQVTHQQVEFLVREFFAGKPEKPGTSAIATHLLCRGSCIVGGDGRLWEGEAARCIKVSPAPEAAGCSLLQLDLIEFLESPVVQERIENRLTELKAEAEKLNMTVTSLKQLRGVVPEGVKES